MVYDYIFCGYGLSAMLILDKLASDGLLAGKSVLVLDNGLRTSKTLCFWEHGNGDFDAILEKSWPKAIFRDQTEFEILQNQNTYKMLNPARLEIVVNQKLKSFPGIEVRKEQVTGFRDNGHYGSVSTTTGKYSSHKIFNSVPQKIESSHRYPLLLQHFRGWLVETQKPSFTEDCATFMDFSIGQNGATRFIYVLPLSPTKALVEYTLFSPDLLDKQEYDSGIEAYLRSKGIRDYKISGTEDGVIPMTAYPFWKNNSANILNIGTAGGWTKPSTGYTLMYAQKKAGKVVQLLKSGTVDFTRFHKSDRFLWYDKIFISVLYYQNASGKHVFSTLFKRADPSLILRFLREETNLLQELVILASCPKRLFLKHLIKSIFRF